MAIQQNIQISPAEEAEELRRQLHEATETLDAIRTGQVDALVVQKGDTHELYTLQTADRAYRTFIEKMTEGAITLNPKGIILYSNQSFADMAHKPLSEVIGISLREFIEPSYLDVFNALFEKCREDDCRGEAYLTGGNLNVPVLLSFAALMQDGEDVYSIIVTDLTEQKNAELQLRVNNNRLEDSNRALELSNRALMQFASIASHDLQEPIRKIRIFSALLKENDEQNIGNDSKRYLDKIITSADRMKMLILDMLDYSGLSAGEGDIRETDMNVVVKEVIEDLELLSSDKQVIYRISSLPVIEANHGRMRQVFQNIISNAIKFSKNGTPPEISISAKPIAKKSFDAPQKNDGKFFLFSVRDNGIGFDPKYAQNIFNLFERLNSKDTYEGTGIGLAITKKIVEKHGGAIKADSKEGKGSEFLILLPVKQSRN